ncbi:hypothetical protein CXU13_06095 [Akkermansia muciniphila]|jgi:hypothetical protein|nr:hypothetical protein CXU16_01590 [Akkermansia muciniphila]PNC30753.1 hypothetical protein CXU17_04200 [Akkermansia muciniphila]PNC32671.1 hypothetical protein CXU12_08530 [Akkermansia muciniphila]PNC59453.1 hypothetical protein CXU13_06095 [Akkermansia muciniphila]
MAGQYVLFWGTAFHSGGKWWKMRAHGTFLKPTYGSAVRKNFMELRLLASSGSVLSGGKNGFEKAPDIW